MCAQEFDSKNPYGFSDTERWHLDELIMRYWDAKDSKERKKIELECYKQFKSIGFKNSYVDYLMENECEELADEMRHFADVFQKVPHEHEKRKAA